MNEPMTPKILQINFRFTVPVTDFQAVCQQAAAALAEVPGVTWKACLINEDEMLEGRSGLGEGGRVPRKEGAQS